MDPDETLARLREWANGDDIGMDAGDAMELFQALDEWLTGGGFPPADWDNG